jgi:hypothetical protein
MAEIRKQKSESRKQRAEVGDPSTINSPLSTIHCLPYQPLDQLAGSLSAADLHVVVMGNVFVGLVHPCKIYNILSVAAGLMTARNPLKSGGCGRHENRCNRCLSSNLTA